jgi:enediyne biosynthesis protein E4
VARVYLNDKGGTGHFAFTPAALPPKPARASAIAVGDIDNDGDLDIVLAQIAGPVRVYINRGDAFLDDRSFTLLPDQVSGDVPNLLLADLDGDCLPELVVPRAGAAPLLWRSAGGGKLSSGVGFDQAVPATGASADDIDADGDPDVLLWGAMTGLQLEVQQ